MRRIVIVGTGFGGLNAARKLGDELGRRRGIEVTVVTDRSHFFFTPLWAAVSSNRIPLADAEVPLRTVLDDALRLELDRVTGLDLETRTVVGETSNYPYDFLILSPGSTVNWRGNEAWAHLALPCKSGRDAVDAREAVDRAVDAARSAEDAVARRRALTFVVAGGGPTGVELTAHLVSRFEGDLHATMGSDQRRDLRIVLVEPQGSLVPDFDAALAAMARDQLTSAGVELRLRDAVVGRTPGRVELSSGDVIASDTLFWCGGVRPPRWLSDSGLQADDQGRVIVHRNLQAVGQHGVYVVGDAASAGPALPMKADIAATQGELAARNVVADLAGRSRRNWHHVPANEVIDLGWSDAAMMWGDVPVSGRSAHALRGAALGRLVPGALRKLLMLRGLFAGVVTRRPGPEADQRLLEE